MGSIFKNIVFDLGGVLIEWNPRYLYRQIFSEEQEMESFLKTVWTYEWNEKLDLGQSFLEVATSLSELHPNYKEEVMAYYHRWEETITGPIDGTVDILKTIAKSNHSVFALTNWSAETFYPTKERFSFLELFEGTVVSGEEKMAKPGPEIYQVLLSRYNLKPNETVFIDDRQDNVDAAKALGIHAIQFLDSDQLKQELTQIKVL